VNYDDETLMAYADGELDEVLSAEISAAVERDPALARRVEQQRALRAKVAGAFATVLDQPLPERLLAAARGPARAEVLPFPARSAPARSPRWGVREWGAMAATLVLGVLLSWNFAPSGPTLISAHDGALVARGALANALDSQLASTQRADDAVQIGLTFTSKEGSYCRSFLVRTAGTAGLACREGGEWRIPVTAAAQLPAEGLRQAASLPAAVLGAVDERIVGDALDAAGEERARRDGWDPKRQ
jgi:anti-sigma factor RsiW